MDEMDSNHLICELEQGGGASPFEIYTEVVRDNIAYDALIEDRPCDREAIDGLVDLMVETVCSKKKTVAVGGEKLPAELVRSRILKLNEGHIAYVLDSLQKNTTQIRNIRAYLLTSLYNAPSTMDSYYRAEVNHDLYGKRRE